MAYTVIDKSTNFFTPKLYTGNGGTTTVTGIPFEPDMTWIKNRSAAGDHEIYDKTRGATYRIYPNATAAQDALAQGLQAWTSDGFRVGNNTAINGNGNGIVSWNWKMNGAGSSNTNGSINTIKTSANTTSGCSISTFTGTGSNATVGHGLGVAPKMVMIKSITAGEDWTCFHEAGGGGKYIILNSAAGFGTNVGAFNNTAPTSSVFSVGTFGATNGSSQTLVAYCFADVTGFSQMGSYIGNGSATDGPFNHTGFSPAFVMVKVTTTTDSWMMYTNKIGATTGSDTGFNTHSRLVEANNNGAEQSSGTNQGIDMFSNGFKLLEDNGNLNGSGQTYIYMAYAQNPFVTSTGIPTTGR